MKFESAVPHVLHVLEHLLGECAHLFGRATAKDKVEKDRVGCDASALHEAWELEALFAAGGEKQATGRRVTRAVE